MQIYEIYSTKRIANVGRWPVRDGKADSLSQIYAKIVAELSEVWILPQIKYVKQSQIYEIYSTKRIADVGRSAAAKPIL